MSHTYDTSVSQHYAAYRPPLHALILARLLGDSRYRLGLDIGCGTGQSSVPLAKYCEEVVAIDPSPDMLKQATVHPRIKYQVGQADDLPVADASVDLIAFAGSLFYTKTPATFAALQRVALTPCTVVVYDFELLIYDVLSSIGFDLPEDSATYDHSVSFSAVAGFEEIMRKKETVELEMTAAQLAHVVLSTHDRYVAIRDRLRAEEPFEELTELLGKGQSQQLGADLYYASYRIEG